MGVSMGLGMGMGMGMAHSSGGRQLSFSLFDNRHAADHWRTPLLCVLSDAQFYFASSKCDREREREGEQGEQGEPLIMGGFPPWPTQQRFRSGWLPSDRLLHRTPTPLEAGASNKFAGRRYMFDGRS